MKRFVDVYMKLWYAQKPTIAAVQGWCIGGGTDMVLCADMIVAGEGARFGYPPSRVWGTPTTAMWVYRMGLERAKRYLLTGDEIPARKAAEIGLILEAVPDDELLEHALGARAAHGARAGEPADHAEAALQPDRGASRTGARRGCSARCSTASRATPRKASTSCSASQEVGFRQAVRERDDPFGDYGSRRTVRTRRIGGRGARSCRVRGAAETCTGGPGGLPGSSAVDGPRAPPVCRAGSAGRGTTLADPLPPQLAVPLERDEVC